MTTIDLVQEIQTLSPAQQESVYSFVYQLKHTNNLHAYNGQKNVEPFANEREAIDFANHYAVRMLNATRRKRT